MIILKKINDVTVADIENVLQHYRLSEGKIVPQSTNKVERKPVEELTAEEKQYIEAMLFLRNMISTSKRTNVFQQTELSPEEILAKIQKDFLDEFLGSKRKTIMMGPPTIPNIVWSRIGKNEPAAISYITLALAAKGKQFKNFKIDSNNYDTNIEYELEDLVVDKDTVIDAEEIPSSPETQEGIEEPVEPEMPDNEVTPEMSEILDIDYEEAGKLFPEYEKLVQENDELESELLKLDSKYTTSLDIEQRKQIQARMKEILDRYSELDKQLEAINSKISKSSAYFSFVRIMDESAKRVVETEIVEKDSEEKVTSLEKEKAELKLKEDRLLEEYKKTSDDERKAAIVAEIAGIHTRNSEISSELIKYEGSKTKTEPQKTELEEAQKEELTQTAEDIPTTPKESKPLTREELEAKIQALDQQIQNMDAKEWREGFKLNAELKRLKKQLQDMPQQTQEPKEGEKKTIFQRIINSNWARTNSIGKRIAAVLIGIKMLFTPTAMLDKASAHEEQVPPTTEVVTQADKEKRKSFRESVELTGEDKDQYDEAIQQIVEQAQKPQKAKENVDMQLGAVLQMPKGIEYTERSTGTGRKGEIGKDEKHSPANGFYVIDYYSVETEPTKTSPGGIEVTQGLEGDIPKSDGKGKVSAHISFIPGATSLEEAQKIIAELKNGKTIDDKKIQSCGWVDMETLEDIMREQQKSQQQKSTQAQIKTNNALIEGLEEELYDTGISPEERN